MSRRSPPAIANGAHTSLPGTRNQKSGGMIPTTVCGAPSSVIVDPTTSGSAANRRFHNPSLMMATRSLPARSSSAVKARPMTGCTPRTWKNPGVT